ncbi:magnesium-translocating P-type ATPase [Candidatus Beckwithbacteria bacterium]|nr:magnesium-translocating P-type ATPase [Candidatus Beckwithbacteria bacterium]
MFKNELSLFANLEIKEILKKLDTSEKGLNPHKVSELHRKFGYNLINVHPQKNYLIEFFKNFLNPLILILIAVSVVSFTLGEHINGFIVLTMVLFSVCFNFLQEFKANKAAEKLKEKVALYSNVIREGKEEKIKAEHLCQGDLIVLNAGDLIPADARVIEAKDFFVNQSVLTGESLPIEKTYEKIKTKDDDLTSLDNIIFSGTNVITGNAKAIIINTGSRTEFGSIAQSLSLQEEDNGFTIGIKNFSNFILRIILLFVIFIFTVNTLIKQDFFESLTFAIAIAVGLTPEFLPMIMTINMAKGALAMSKKGVIVKKLNTIPSFGSMNILCTDKTGTITENKIELVKYLDLMGNHYHRIFEMAYLNSFLQTGINNPLDDAVKNYEKVNISTYEKIDEIPFDFERKRMSVIVKKGHDHLLITKGAPESIINKSKNYEIKDQIYKFDKESRKLFIRQYEELSANGYRVLALAVKILSKKKAIYEKDEEEDLTFLGFTAFLDPVKTHVKNAILQLENIGIEIKVITGDNELVSKKVCEDAGIKIKGIMLGYEINHLNDHQLSIRAQKNTIFARFSPAQKNRVINALRKAGHIVGYMGDGINDAPSLKSADVGISVSNAVDVAKESADFILTNKNLLELTDGVIEGRKIFGNTMKYIMMGLSSNFGNMFSVLGAVLFLPFLPMLPIQILLNNFLYDISQISIPTDNVDKEYLQEPKKWDIHLIRSFMLIFGPISSFFDFITFYVLYHTFANMPNAFQTGWFIESLATQTLVIHIIRTKKLPFIQSRPSKYLFSTTIFATLIGWIIPYTVVGQLFNLMPLPTTTILTLIAIVLCYLVCVEIGKRIFYYNKEKTKTSDISLQLKYY